MKLCIWAVLCLAALPAAPAAAGPVRVKPAVTVHGANVELRGSGFRGTRTVVRIGGRRAAVTRGTRRLLRVVVPKLRPGRHAIVAGRRHGNIRLVRPYRGRVGVRRDTRRAKHATIGPAGGTLRTRAADGTVLTLTVPAGALAKATPLTISPARVRGLPFSGEFSVAAHFAPEGLRFARPARLTMRLKRKPKRGLVGFDAAGNGTGLGFGRARVSGRTITKNVDHFSVDGAGSAAPQDILIFLQGIVESEFPLPVGQIELLREQVGIWVELFGPDVCIELCSAVQEIVIASLVFHIDDACDDARAAPSLAGYERIVALDGMRSIFGGNEEVGAECRSEILTTIVDSAITAAAVDPLATAETGELPQGDDGLQLDGRERVTWFEWLVHLSTQAQAVGENVLRARLDAAADAARPRMIVLNRPDCDTDHRERATENLATAWDYAVRLGDLLVEETRSALDYCRVEVDMAAQAAFAPGGQRQLSARVSGLVDPTRNNGVSWSASAGTITAGGLYTAPLEPGSYTVTLKSAHNPNRSWVAPITVACSQPVLLAAFAQAEESCSTASVTFDRRFTAMDVSGQACADACSSLQDGDVFSEGGAYDNAVSVAPAVTGASASAAASQTSTVAEAGGGLTVTGQLHADVTTAEGDETFSSGEADNVLRVEFDVATADAGFEISGGFANPGDQNPVVYLVCSGIEVFRAEGETSTTFGESGALDAGSCQLIAEAHSDRDTSGTSNVTVNLTFSAA